MASPAPGGAGFAQRAAQLRVLLIEGDDGDALLASAYVSKPVDFEHFCRCCPY